MTEKQTIRILNQLHRLCKAGERGFEVVAQNVSNRGLKIVLKSYAQQRAGFAAELKAEVQLLGGRVSERRSMRGIIHRGRINIRTALTIGVQNMENVALGEARHGENAAVKAFERALHKELPAETKATVERQYKGILAARDEVNLLRGNSGERLVVRLFDSESDSERAVEALVEGDFERANIEVSDVQESTSTYRGEGSTVGEAVVSGAVGGAIWGTVIGFVAGLAPVLIPRMGAMIAGSEVTTWIVVTVAGAVFGALFGAILGFLIGKGTSEEDAFLYDDSMMHGTKLLRLLTESERAPEAALVLYKVNVAARHQSGYRQLEQPAEPEAAEAS